MKKSAATLLLILTLLAALSLCGCGQKNSIPEPEVTYELLYAAEDAPAYDFGLTLVLCNPSTDAGLFPGAFARKYHFTVSEGEAVFVAHDDVMPGYQYGPKLNRRGRKKEREQFNTVARLHFAYEDAEIWIYEVSEDAAFEDKPVEYAGQTVAVEMDGKKTRCTVIPDAEEGKELTFAYVGRIGDILYLEHGFYDVKDKTAKAYTDVSELPPVTQVVTPLWRDLKLYKNDETVISCIGDLFVYELMTERVGDTVYYLVGTNERYLDADGSYGGDTAFLIAYDLFGERVTRIEKYNCANMNIHYGHLTVTADDGKVYTPYPEK